MQVSKSYWKPEKIKLKNNINNFFILFLLEMAILYRYTRDGIKVKKVASGRVINPPPPLPYHL